ncbi:MULTISPECIES: hypothetical protein [unclassified Streptomyces]|uniref:hypothetical protein n=1 Tax=unclassified Streptomyces TaxID=2593676 RepID=UPI002DDC5892|nr:hypothetical protein [Streptomyces sp. NBC_01750]WSA98763.1 hypothetical protein OIE54_05545 [Streptomyces sp. NBC_01794]WSD36668.1 hypothetical protein OG966_35025 [Streptomyces sp. NBC_01750]
MAEEPAPKHLTITMDFDLQTAGSTVGAARVRAAYEAAAKAAIVAAMKHLPEGSVKNITTEMDWSYRWDYGRHVRFERDGNDVAEQGQG